MCEYWVIGFPHASRPGRGYARPVQISISTFTRSRSKRFKPMKRIILYRRCSIASTALECDETLQANCLMFLPKIRSMKQSWRSFTLSSALSTAANSSCYSCFWNLYAPKSCCWYMHISLLGSLVDEVDGVWTTAISPVRRFAFLEPISRLLGVSAFGPQVQCL